MALRVTRNRRLPFLRGNSFRRENTTPRYHPAMLGLVPLALIGGYLGARHLRRRPAATPALPPALSGTLERLTIPFGQVAYYRDGPADGVPLLLIHSINAAANAYEVKPLYDHYARTRAVYALDLPGFGFSDRHDRIYTPQLMMEAILALVEVIRAAHGSFPIDAIALSTSAEFLARAAGLHPMLFRTLGLISPTGLQAKRPGDGAPGSTYGRPSVRDVLSFPPWGRALFDLLVSRPSIRFFLGKTWGSPDIDEGLLAYDLVSAHQPNAQHAPFSFVAGFLFSADAMTLYKALTMPVWMCHGIRGDFVDFDRKVEVEGRSNWTVRVFRTGAMAHFERLDEVTAAYDDFVDRAT